MDIKMIIDTLQQIAPQIDLVTLLVGSVTTLLVQGAKKLQSIPLNPNNIKAVRIVSAVLAFLGTFGVAWADGNLAGADFTQVLRVTVEGVITYMIAHVGYESVLRTKKDQEEKG